MLAALLQHLGDNRLLADMALGDMLNRDPGFSGQRCRRLAHPIAQCHGKLRVVENTDLVGVEEPRHPVRVADGGERPGHHNPVVAGQHFRNSVAVAFHKCAHHGTLDYRGVGWRCYSLFGSGSSGLGKGITDRMRWHCSGLIDLMSGIGQIHGHRIALPRGLPRGDCRTRRTEVAMTQ